MKEIITFNANRNELVIPSNISQVIATKAKDGKTFDGGKFAICTFKAFAEKMGVVKPIKGGDRTEWNDCKRIYNDAKEAAGKWINDNMALAAADKSLVGREMTVQLFRGKNGAVRRKVSFTLSDPNISEQKHKETPKLTRTQLEAAAKQYGFVLVEQEELALS